MALIRHVIPTTLASLLLFSASVLAETPTEHFGMCDASAAVAVGERHFLVANDEDNILRLYERGTSGKPTYVLDLSAFLKNEGKKKPHEADIEGAAMIGNRVYWITSHGTNSEGEPRPARHHFFATEVKQVQGKVAVEPVGTSYRDLIKAFAADSRLKKYALEEAARKPPEAAGGLNIEGLSATPQNTLFIGFRNPVFNSQALVIPLENPQQVVEGKEPPKLGVPIELRLGGLGIRSMEFVPALNAYLIVAGPHDDRKDFKLYTWSGSDKDDPRLLQQALKDSADLRPEAFVVYPGNSKSVTIVSDDGTRQIESSDCKKIKDTRTQRFRTLSVSY